jgi:hypothetical protein
LAADQFKSENYFMILNRTSPSLPFEHFLRRARRHWTVWTIAECAGLGLLCGCCCVFLLLPILLWRGQPGAGIAIVFPTGCAVLGAIAGFRRRPALRLVAQFADDRYQTADLLATALALRDSPEAWHQIILKLADARAASLSPAGVTPHQLGTRAWSGIALAMAAAISLALLSMTTAPIPAQAASMPASPDAWRTWEQYEITHRGPLQNASSTEREARAETTPDSQSISMSISMSMSNANDSSADASSARSSPGDSNHSEAQATIGAGQGSSQNDRSLGTAPTIHTSPDSSNKDHGDAIASGGAGHDVKNPSDTGVTAGQVSTGQNPAPPPWAGSDWPAAPSAATAAVRSVHVPDSYRALVRDYFQNQDPPAAPDPPRQ